MPPKKGGKKGATGYKMAPKLPNGTVLQVVKNLVSDSYLFDQLGPGRPSAGGPRMDRRAVTSPGVVKISRLASRT